MIWTTNKGLIEEGKKQAKICLENHEEIRLVPFGRLGAHFVSADPEQLIPTDCFDIDGVTFYLGFKNRNS